MGKERESSPDALRRAVERAMRRGEPVEVVRRRLESLIEVAEPGSDHSFFGHRQLAEILIEEHPWKAALHLREVAKVCSDDDVVHALMGLCQALLGNFMSAVAAYRRALHVAPRNPWYHHNLGHLLDVALSKPQDAERHLRAAHRMEPLEHEITASLAHCLARLDELKEAQELMEEAVAAAPENEDHRSLLEWIEDGAPEQSGPRRGPTRDRVQRERRSSVPSPPSEPPTDRMDALKGRGRTDAELWESETGDEEVYLEDITPPGAKSARRRREEVRKDVERALQRGMMEAGFSPRQIERARLLWADFLDGCTPRIHKPESYAAAIEYAFIKVKRIPGLTQASVAKRYGIDRRTLTSRFAQIRDALALIPGDPRYA
ncbi:MAG: tetratricopeptide repeat protein [Myxococcota bacterium]